MSNSEVVLGYAANFALAMFCLTFALAVWRVIVGPTLADRILALDLLVAAAIAFIAVFAIKTGFSLYIDIAIGLGLVGFLATVAFAGFILKNAGKNRATELATVDNHVE